jgi:hypothetical protein
VSGAAEVSSPWILPPLDGELAGEFTPLLLPGAPPVKWRATVRSDQPRERVVGFALDGPGVKLRGSAVLDPRGEGSWRLAEAVIDLGEWFGWLAPRFLPAAENASLNGELTVRGEGTWRGGQLGGRAELALRDGRFEDMGRKLVVEGIAFEVELADVAARRTAGRPELTWRGGRYDVIPFGSGRVEFALDGDRVRVSSATLALFGGELQTAAVELSMNKPALALTAQLHGVELERILFLLPPVLAAAQGRLDGRLELRSDENGLQIGVGRLTLRQGDNAELRLAPSPGLLSTQLPEAVRQHYPGLGQLEMGRIPLRAERLEVFLNPAGDEEGRTATVRLEGGPADPALKAPVVLQINVRGPLDSLVKFGTHSKLGFGGGGVK